MTDRPSRQDGTDKLSMKPECIPVQILIGAL